MILPFINIRKVPREVLKTEGEGFQHFPRDLANVNKWKIMFDPSSNNYWGVLACFTDPTLPSVSTLV